MKPRKPKDIGKRFCKTCARETRFKFSESRNAYICELCDYEESIGRNKLLESEDLFLKALDDLRNSNRR
jgi:hypothetical protein